MRVLFVIMGVSSNHGTSRATICSQIHPPESAIATNGNLAEIQLLIPNPTLLLRLSLHNMFIQYI